LSYANEHRPWELYRKIFLSLYERCRQIRGKRKFLFKNKLLSLDSTVIDLCMFMYDWAKFRRTKGAIKFHLILDHDGYLPSFAVIIDGKCADVKVAYTPRFDPGTIVVDDRGYNDYHLFAKWTSEGVYFVTRQKGNAVYTVMETKPLPRKRSHILKDEVIAFTGAGAAEKCPYLLCRVEFYEADKEQVFVFLTFV
jgi:hypothetical protein